MYYRFNKHIIINKKHIIINNTHNVSKFGKYPRNGIFFSPLLAIFLHFKHK